MTTFQTVDELCAFLDSRVKVKMPKFVETSNWGSSLGIRKQVQELNGKAGKIYYATGNEELEVKVEFFNYKGK